MNYWLMKSEPDEASIHDLQRAGTLPWTGVRNYQARNFMRDAMRVGDGVLFYHSSCAEPGIAGLAEVASYADGIGPWKYYIQSTKCKVLALSGTYGELDGENNYHYATVFAQVYAGMTPAQKAKLAATTAQTMSAKKRDAMMWTL